MKIGIFDPYLDDCGGGEKYMMTIAEYLSKDHDISVFWNNKKDLENISERFDLDLTRVHLEDNIFEYSFLSRIKSTSKFDLIIFLSDGSIPISLSKKLILHVQRPIDNFGNDIRSKIKLFRVSKVFCNSEFTKKYIDKSSGLNTSVLFPPVELKPKTMNRENIILHVGRFRVVEKTVSGGSDFKKQSMMIDTFKKMSEVGIRGWRLVLAVSVLDKDRDAFKNYIDSAKGYDIDFLINQNNNKVWEFYSKAKIYWHASGYGEDLKESPQLAEHFGISTVEAMGGGCVPVVINAGGQKEIVTDGYDGYLWNTKEELIQRTFDLISNKTLLNKLSENAKVSAQKYSKEKFCKRVDELINT